MIFSDILFQNIMAKKGSFLVIIGLEIYHLLHSNPILWKGVHIPYNEKHKHYEDTYANCCLFSLTVLKSIEEFKYLFLHNETVLICYY